MHVNVGVRWSLSNTISINIPNIIFALNEKEGKNMNYKYRKVAAVACALPLDGEQLWHEAGIYLVNASVLIQGNTFDGIGGIGIWCTEGSDAQIVGNTITNCNETGIYCNASSPTINNNTITYNYHGIYCENGAYAIIHYNNITGNVHYGVINVDSLILVDATYNWWGDWKGPTHPSNPWGEGDWVSDYVLFNPWLTAPYP
jgi:parallel beta-helix repeat protein